MKRPIFALNKPRKNELPPDKYQEIYKILAIDNNEQIVLLDMGTRIDDIDFSVLEKLTFNQISKIKSLLPIGVDDFEIAYQADEDGYFEYFFIKYRLEKSNDSYLVELEEYNNRFLTYEKKLKEYNEELLKYKAFLYTEKVKKAEKQLLKLKHEKS